MLAPAAALCDTDFDLQVDELRFIGRPTIIGGASNSETSESGAIDREKPAQFNVHDVERVSPRRKRLSMTSSKRLGEQDETTPADYATSARVEGREAVGGQAPSTRANRRTNSQKRIEIREREEKESQRIFHVVFVIDSRKMTGAQRGESIKSWQALAARLVSALLLEEKRTGYIAQEIATMRRLREEHNIQKSPSGGVNDKHGSGNGGSASGSISGNGGAAIDGDKMKTEPKPLAQQFLEHSDLARVMEELYRGLVSPAAGAAVLINGWIRLDLYVNAAQATTCSRKTNAPITLKQGSELGQPHHQRHDQLGRTVQIDPHQSYMLLRDRQDLLADLPIYASPAVRTAIERANPCLGVYTLAERMSISVERLVTVCVSLRHLGLYLFFEQLHSCI